MIVDREPAFGHGFIIFLVINIGGIYKIGLTTNSVKQCRQELHTTGVPTPFKAVEDYIAVDIYIRVNGTVLGI